MGNTISDTEWGKAIVFSACVITFILFMIGINYYGGINNLLNAIANFPKSISNLFHINLNLHVNYTYIAVIILVIILFAIGCIVFYSIYLVTAYLQDKTKLEKKEADEAEMLLNKVFPIDEQQLTIDIERIQHLIKRSKVNRKLKRYLPELKKRLAKAIELLETARKERFEKKISEEVEKKTQEKEILTRENEELEEENRIKSSRDEANLGTVRYLLRAYEIPVFKKEKLNRNQIKALEEDGFEQVNEYSLVEQKFIRVLIKRRANQSPTHTFLVWDAMRLLKKIKGASNIWEHETVDADVTFKFNNRKYALEIEKGTLLGKKKQTQDKIDYMNKKYRKRWMFIVSNKNLLSKYKKLGFTTTRKRVSEDLDILLKR